MRAAHPGRYAQDQKYDHGSNPRPEEEPKPNDPKRPQSARIDTPAPPDHYAKLGVEKCASQAEILKTAKSMRIKVHPDRLKRHEGLTQADLDAIDEQAKKVGWAAVILCNMLAKAKYDREIGNQQR